MTDPITHHADAILRAAGSSKLAHYMPGTQDHIRAAVTAAIKHGRQEDRAWRDAVQNALSDVCMSSDNPREAVRLLIEWEQRIALDPRVSKDAEALVLHGIELGLCAAADDAAQWFPARTAAHHPASGVVGAIRALDPAAILAQSAGVGDE